MGKKDTRVRMSLQTLRVLEAFLENPTQQLAGAEVHQRCGIASGTLYPILLDSNLRVGLSASGNPLIPRAREAAPSAVSADFNGPETCQ
jgi:hypothetical protein